MKFKITVIIQMIGNIQILQVKNQKKIIHYKIKIYKKIKNNKIKIFNMIALFKIYSVRSQHFLIKINKIILLIIKIK